jgi:hypothetical protein
MLVGFDTETTTSLFQKCIWVKHHELRWDRKFKFSHKAINGNYPANVMNWTFLAPPGYYGTGR